MWTESGTLEQFREGLSKAVQRAGGYVDCGSRRRQAEEAIKQVCLEGGASLRYFVGL